MSYSDMRTVLDVLAAELDVAAEMRDRNNSTAPMVRLIRSLAAVDPRLAEMPVGMLHEALELLRIKQHCTCGYAGQHRSGNPRCKANQ